MTKKVVRKPKNSLGDKLAVFLSVKSQAALAKIQADKLRKELLAEVESRGETDEYGNIWLELDDPIEVLVTSEKTGRTERKTFAQLKRQINARTTFAEDEAMALLESKGLVEQATVTVTYVDQDALYVLQQEGKITEEELRALFKNDPYYSFVPTA